MKYLILKAGVFILKMVYVPFSVLKIQDKITYISRQSDDLSLDFSLLIDEVERRKTGYKNVILARKIIGGNKSVITYPFHMIHQMYHMATSRYVILDGYCITVSILKHKAETKVIQIWHASSAIKKFGYQTLDKEAGNDGKIAEIMCMHRNYDYIFASSRATAEHFCQAFNASMDQIKYIGMPHFDTLKVFDNEADMDATYPKLKERNTVLYLPTFRKGETLPLQSLIDNFDFERYNLSVRLHPLDMTERVDEKVIYDDKFSTYDWIKKADVVIADYSSLIAECAWLGKKIFFYLYDYDEYSHDPGLNVDLEQEGLSKAIFKNTEELTEILRADYDWEALRRFAKKYIDINIENSIQKFVDFMFEGR